MASNSKTFTFEEVSKHNNKMDCWIIVNGKVYDVTPFLDDHPGGDESLISSTAKDATDDFEDVGHSDSAVKMMQKYLVGVVDSSTLPTTANHNPPPPTLVVDTNNPSSSGFVSKTLQFLLPLLILACAFAFQYYGKNKHVSDS